MNIAILMHGVLHRSLRFTIDSISANLIRPLEEIGNVDIYYHSWDIAEIYNPRAGELNVRIDVADIAKHLPQARGILEDQRVFDASVDCKAFYTDSSPMMQCSGSKEEAMLASMNYIRDAESQLRAFNYYMTNKDKHYEFAILARPDVRYLNKLNLTNIKLRENLIFTPSFHSWGGVNDRFAIGTEDAIRTYCYRGNAAHEWLVSGGHYNSETFLSAYLKANNISVEFIDFVFQRIRSTGRVYSLDKKLARKKSLLRQWAEAFVNKFAPETL